MVLLQAGGQTDGRFARAWEEAGGGKATAFLPGEVVGGGAGAERMAPCGVCDVSWGHAMPSFSVRSAEVVWGGQ